MQFYMCKTAEGEQLAGTQADAKALDRAFKPHDVPTDKAGLMGYVNGLLKRIQPPKAVVVPDGVVAALIHETEKPAPAPKTKVSIMDRIYTRTECEHAIWNMGLEDVRALSEVLNERTKELALPPITAARVRTRNAVQRVAPAPRARTRTPA